MAFSPTLWLVQHFVFRSDEYFVKKEVKSRLWFWNFNFTIEQTQGGWDISQVAQFSLIVKDQE